MPEIRTPEGASTDAVVKADVAAPSEASRTTARAAGQHWGLSGYEQDGKAIPVHTLTACLADAARRAAAMEKDGASAVEITEMLDQFLAGLRDSLARQAGSAVRGTRLPVGAVDDLLDGRTARWSNAPWCATRYAVCVVLSAKKTTRTGAQAEVTAVEQLPGVLRTCRDDHDVILVPDEDKDHSQEILSAVVEQYGAKSCIAVARRATSEVASGYCEALDVLRLTIADRRPVGIYRIDDVLVEYAIAQSPRVCRALVGIVRPLAQHPSLRETLMAWLDADCNRLRAAQRMVIHPTTLDYRLGRVRQLTGYDPTSPRGSRTLAAALLADNLS